jgi:hypothetical protein
MIVSLAHDRALCACARTWSEHLAELDANLEHYLELYA